MLDNPHSNKQNLKRNEGSGSCELIDLVQHNSKLHKVNLIVSNWRHKLNKIR